VVHRYGLDGNAAYISTPFIYSTILLRRRHGLQKFCFDLVELAGIKSIPEICMPLFDDTEFTDPDRLAKKG
jgi:hypothetical protein